MVKPVGSGGKHPRKPRVEQTGKLNKHVVSSLMKSVPTWTFLVSKEIMTIRSPEERSSKQELQNRVKLGKVEKEK